MALSTFLLGLLLAALGSLSTGQPTTDLSGSNQSLCPDKSASEERQRILMGVLSLTDDIRESRESQTSPSHTMPDCNQGWALVAGFESHQYMIGPDHLSWPEARERCFQCGYSLAKIESTVESNFIRDWFNSAGVQRFTTALASGVTHVWTDGTDMGHEGCWVTTQPEVARFLVTDSFSFWEPGQPNNYQGQHCAGIWYERRWKGSDVACDSATPYLCEKAPDQPSHLPSMEQVRNTSECRP